MKMLLAIFAIYTVCFAAALIDWTPRAACVLPYSDK